MDGGTRGDPGRILLVGGGGRLGRLVTQGLLAQGGWRPRLLSRHPDAARERFGTGVEVIAGGIEDGAALDVALKGVSRLFLLTPIARDLADLQRSVIAAAERAAVRRVVKISGSDWTIAHQDRSRAGQQHARAEERLAESAAETVSIRPNAWAQVSLAGRVAAWAAGTEDTPAHKDAPVSYIDIADIADVAVHALIAPQPPERRLVLTGPEALRWADISVRLPPRAAITRLPAPRQPPDDPFHAAAVREFHVLIGEGRAATVTPTVADLLGRPARTIWPLIEALIGTP